MQFADVACALNAQTAIIFRRLDSRCLQSVHAFRIFSGTFQYRQTEIPYFETDKIPLTVSSPRVISFAMQPSNNSQPNRRNRSHVGRCPLSAPSVLHSDILLIRPPSSPLFIAKGHPQPWKLKIPIFWHPCLNSLIILSWLHLGINTISYKISPSISESVCRNQTVFPLHCFHKKSALFLLFLYPAYWLQNTKFIQPQNSLFANTQCNAFAFAPKS